MVSTTVEKASAMKMKELNSAIGVASIGKNKGFKELLEDLKVQKDISPLYTAAGKLSSLYYEVKDMNITVASTSKSQEGKKVPLHAEINSIIEDAQKLMDKEGKMHEPKQLKELINLQTRVDRLEFRVDCGAHAPKIANVLSDIKKDIGRALSKFMPKKTGTYEEYSKRMDSLMAAVKEVQHGSSRSNQAEAIKLIPAMSYVFNDNPELMAKTTIKDAVRKTVEFLGGFNKLSEELSVIRGKLAAIDADPNRHWRKGHIDKTDKPRELSDDEKHQLALEAYQAFEKLKSKHVDLLHKIQYDNSPASQIAHSVLQAASVTKLDSDKFSQTAEKVEACRKQYLTTPIHIRTVSNAGSNGSYV
jgi:hypothetical protein